MTKSHLIACIASPLLFMASCTPANAGLTAFTQHQIVHMVQHGVNKYHDVEFPTGDYPYLGQVGLEYQFKNVSYSLSYIHRSNVDIGGFNPFKSKEKEYNYNGIAIGVRLQRCLSGC